MKIEESVLKPETHWKNIGRIPVGKSHAADKGFFDDSLYHRFILDLSVFSSHLFRFYGRGDGALLFNLFL
jgi:hypothetical protein